MANIEKWHFILEKFKDETNGNHADLILGKAELKSISGKKMSINLDPLSKTLLFNNNNYYLKILEKIIKEEINENIEIEIKDLKKSKKKKGVSSEENINVNYAKSQLLDNFTFNNFFATYDNKKIMTINNEIIKGQDGKTNNYNSLFIYGGSGVGKTHIANAIGNGLFQKNSNINILYTSAGEFLEDFTKQFYQNNNNSKNVFSEKYKSLDVFILDDIQVLVNKENTLMEFFNIYDKMLTENKLIIMTSDINIKMLDLPERLSGRIMRGLLQEVFLPDSDTRIEIFKFHADKKNLDISEKAIQVFVNNSSNVRELIGFINTVLIETITKDTVNQEFSEENAIDLINDITMNISHTKNDIVNIICDHFDVSQSDIIKKSVKSEHKKAKMFCIYYLHEYTLMTQKEIGILFEYKGHSNIAKLLKEFNETFKDANINHYKVLSKKIYN